MHICLVWNATEGQCLRDISDDYENLSQTDKVWGMYYASQMILHYNDDDCDDNDGDWMQNRGNRTNKPLRPHFTITWVRPLVSGDKWPVCRSEQDSVIKSTNISPFKSEQLSKFATICYPVKLGRRGGAKGSSWPFVKIEVGVIVLMYWPVSKPKSKFLWLTVFWKKPKFHEEDHPI